MKISTVALGMTLAVLWGASFCGMGAIHAAFPGYGTEFFRIMASIYPGMRGDGSIPDIAIGTAYGLADGFFFGFLMAWIYNSVLTKIARG